MAEHRHAAIWSPESLADLDGIWNYYLQIAGRNTADKIVREIGEAVNLLKDHPFGGSVLRPGFETPG
jgi:plasmid stabilization system protein ParE